MAQQQQLLLKFRIDDVRSKTFRYRSKKKQKIPWSRYDRAQENEFPEVVQLIRLLVDRASSQLVLPPDHDATGNTSYPKADLAKLILSQQYDGRCNRVSIGLLSLLNSRLGITACSTRTLSYKTLERAYQDTGVLALLNDVFFLTQLPVVDMEHNFAFDGTCHPTTIKQNWESSKDEILRLLKERPSTRKRKKKLEFEKTILAVGTTFKIIASFARTSRPFANESPCLRPLLEQVLELYTLVAKVCADSGFLSRENCTLIGKVGAVPRIFPRKGASIKGSQAWRKMLVEFIQDTQSWLREYHSRSIVESVNSTMKRLFTAPLRKRLLERKATELLARIIVYNIRQLVYLKYTKQVKLEFKKNTKPRVMTLLNWIDT